jgi:hypothetical protein
LPKLYKSLATRLCTGLHTNLADSAVPLLTYAGDLVFSRAGDVYVWYDGVL